MRKINLNPQIAADRVIPMIFRAQLQHAKEYAAIETGNGFWHPLYPGNSTDIEKRESQAWLRRMFWYATEELMEATELPVDLSSGWLEKLAEDPRRLEFVEELSDSIHFIAEVSAILKLDEERITKEFQDVLSIAMTPAATEGSRTVRAFPDQCMASLGIRIFRVTQAMGLAANCLKNKPWKQSIPEFDQARFTLRCYKIWVRLAELMGFLEIPIKAMYSIYTVKSEINKQRRANSY